VNAYVHVAVAVNVVVYENVNDNVRRQRGSKEIIRACD
jgi:hypothetical protein